MKKLLLSAVLLGAAAYGAWTFARPLFGDELTPLSAAAPAAAFSAEVPARHPGVSTAIRQAEEAHAAVAPLADPKEAQQQKLVARDAVCLALNQEGLTVAEFDRLSKLLHLLNDELVFSRAAAPGSRFVVVRAGDSLGVIARRAGTTVGLLHTVNRLTTDLIWPGQTLKVLEGAPGLLIDKSDYCLRYYVGDLLVRVYRVGIGAADSTPEGVFTIANKIEHPTWKGLPPDDPNNVLGSRWLGFAPQGTLRGYGIHGTKDPSSIGRAESSGCLRMLNADVEELYDLVAENTLVKIQD